MLDKKKVKKIVKKELKNMLKKELRQQIKKDIKGFAIKEKIEATSKKKKK